MNFADYTGPGRPFRGSTDWAAAQIERLLEEEERRRHMALSDAARHRLVNVALDDAGLSDPDMSPRDSAESAATEPPPGPMVINRAPRYRGELMPGLRGEPFLNNQESSELLFSTIPIAGDAYGFYSDFETFRNDPASRTWGNYGLTAAGLLPFIPGGMTKIVRKGGEKLEDVLKANPRTRISDIPADATGRLGKPITRETVIRVADEMQRRFDNIEKGRFVLIAGGGRKERALQPSGYDGIGGKRLVKGANFGDIVFIDRKTGKQFVIQVARTGADGRPIAEELDAALKIARTPTRIPRPYRDVDELMKLERWGEHTVLVVTPPSDW